MAKNIEIREAFIERLKTVEVDGKAFLKSVSQWEREPENFPALRYLYRPHGQGQYSTAGILDIALGQETGVHRFTYSWLWELFVPINAGEQVALERYEEFDVNMGITFARDSHLGGLVDELSITPRQDPALNAEKNARYVLVQYDFATIAEEEV